MLQVKVNMNTSAEEVLAFKACCGLQMFDQNLEILITNLGDQAVTMLSAFKLVTDDGTRYYENLMPAGPQRIEPGEVKAFYCQMGEEVWKNARELILHDSDGEACRVVVIDQS